MNGYKAHTDGSPSTPGHLAPFDWEEFEGRYDQALAEANNQEKELLEEFERLVKVRRGFSRNNGLPADIIPVLQRLGIRCLCS